MGSGRKRGQICSVHPVPRVSSRTEASCCIMISLFQGLSPLYLRRGYKKIANLSWTFFATSHNKLTEEYVTIRLLRLFKLILTPIYILHLSLARVPPSLTLVHSSYYLISIRRPHASRPRSWSERCCSQLFHSFIPHV